MGYGMIVLLTAGAFVGTMAILFGVYIFTALYKANKREARLTCSCGKRAYLYNRQNCEDPVFYAYMCECGVKGYVGLSKEEAYFGWELRGNKSAYMDYIIAKQMKIKK